MEESSPLIGYYLRILCNCHFSGRHAAHVYRTECMVPQEGGDVSPIPDGKLW